MADDIHPRRDDHGMSPGHETTTLPEPPDGWILYDDSCGFCRECARLFSGAYRRRGLAMTPLREPWVGCAPDRDMLTDIRLLLPNGEYLSGPDVYRFLMKQIWWAYPLYILSLTPGCRQLFNLGYRMIARNRYRISRLFHPG